MFQVEADSTNNLLKFHFSGQVGAEEAKQGLESVKSQLETLQPGFRLLTDLSRLESMDPACAAYIRRTMDWCNKKGIARVVRVIPDPHKDIGLKIMSLFHYRHDVPIVTCGTPQEALAALAE
jgi:hypothetical protein